MPAKGKCHKALMTKLTKEVRRITYALHRGREIVVAMRPPDLLTFRLKGTRKEYPLSVVGAFNLAAKVEANHMMKCKAEARKARKAARAKGM